MKKFLTVEEVGELLQVSRSTIYEWTHSGFIPHYKFPKNVRFKAIEVEEWLKRRKRRGRASYRLKITNNPPL